MSLCLLVCLFVCLFWGRITAEQSASQGQASRCRRSGPGRKGEVEGRGREAKGTVASPLAPALLTFALPRSREQLCDCPVSSPQQCSFNPALKIQGTHFVKMRKLLVLEAYVKTQDGFLHRKKHSWRNFLCVLMLWECVLQKRKLGV